MLLLGVCAGVGLYSGYKIAWLIMVAPVVLFMAWEWYRHELSQLLPVADGKTPAEILNQSLLAKIHKAEISTDEWLKVMQSTPDYWFIANRFLVLTEYLEHIIIADGWWQRAVELYHQYPTKYGVDAVHIVAAMILTSPDKLTLLSQSQNSEDDIMQAVSWHVYVTELVDSMHNRQDEGGIARDWAVGYTPLLDSYATNITRSVQYGGLYHRQIVGHSNVVNQMNSVFSSNGRSNIALVGEVGSGKSTCVQAFAESLLFDNVPKELKFSHVYQVDASALLTKLNTDNIEYAIQRLAAESYNAKNIILYFENAGVFFGSDNSIDITNILLPIIEAGRVRMIFSFSPIQWQYIQRVKPQLVALLNYQSVNPTAVDDTLLILQNQALFTEAQYKCMFSHNALKEIYTLAERFGPEIAMPGKAISILEDVARNYPQKLIVKSDVQKTIEQTTGVKVATADIEEKQELLSLEAKIKERVVGQEAAIQELVSALKRSRTGVASSNKPIGTFLFLGPTGVGKTEVSKTLADVYFGGKSGLVRVDMNEYITQDSVHALLAGRTDFGQGLLETIRRQPFSVVLFDEIEKAHPDIVNVMLQLLDEGEIKDSDNRTVSFKNSIIIATSNAGSDDIRHSISLGKPLQDIASGLIDNLINQGTFKPEFINRFDDVIVFTPLTQQQLRDVVGILLKSLNQQLTSQGYQVILSEDAVDWLATQGYDERLGARPLRRMMQKTVETALSNRLLEQQIPHGSTVTLNTQDLETAKNI